MSDRTINFGESETEATYQIQDTDSTGGGNFVVAKDTNANTVLLQYDPTTDTWEYAGDVDMNGGNVSGVGTLTADSVNTDDLESEKTIPGEVEVPLQEYKDVDSLNITHDNIFDMGAYGGYIIIEIFRYQGREGAELYIDLGADFHTYLTRDMQGSYTSESNVVDAPVFQPEDGREIFVGKLTLFEGDSEQSGGDVNLGTIERASVNPTILQQVDQRGAADGSVTLFTKSEGEDESIDFEYRIRKVLKE